VIWQPSCLLLKSRHGGDGEVGNKGNVLKTVGGDTEEWRVGELFPAKEISRMTGGKAEGDKGKEEVTARESFENGVSIEGEFAFTRAIGSYCREAVREGRYKGGYKFNIKEQMAQRALVEKRKTEKVRVLFMGGEPNWADHGGVEESGERRH
jgi:hypothetical protein